MSWFGKSGTLFTETERGAAGGVGGQGNELRSRSGPVRRTEDPGRPRCGGVLGALRTGGGWAGAEGVTGAEGRG